MKKTTLKMVAAAVLATFALSGCATGYDKYIAQVDSINKANAEQNQLKLAALRSDNETIAKLAEGGSDAVKVAAANSIAMQNIVAVLAGGGKAGSDVVVPQPPKSAAEQWLQFASLLVPSTVQAIGIFKNADVAIRQSDNSTAVALSTNQAFTSISTLGMQAVASVNQKPNVTITAQGDAINGDNNVTNRTTRTCTGGSATGSGGAAAAGGAGGTGATDGGAGAASGAAGNGAPVAGAGTC